MANLKKNDELFFLIPPSSRILVPCSEEDHSLFLLDVLNRYKTYFAKKRFEVIPVCFAFSPSTKGMKGIPFLSHLEVEQEKEARIRANEKYASYCSKLKRVAMGKEADALNCGFIALPTCFEEAYEAYSKNLLEEGELKTFSFLSKTPSSKARFIRPFLSCDEASLTKGEEELNLTSRRLYAELPFSMEQRQAIKKAFFYNENVSFPSLSQTPALPLLNACHFENRNGRILALKGEETLASFKTRWLDAHRLSIYEFACEDDDLAKKILDSFCLLTLRKKKPPLQIILNKPFIASLKGFEICGEQAYKKIWRKEDILHEYE